MALALPSTPLENMAFTPKGTTIAQPPCPSTLPFLTSFKLIKCCSNPACPTPPLHAQYKKTENVMYIFADDTAPRYVSATLPLDYDTVAVADKFGNLGILRLPADVSQQV